MSVMKMIVASFWIAVLLGMTAEHVTFPTPGIANLFYVVFIVGAMIITLIVKFPRTEEK